MEAPPDVTNTNNDATTDPLGVRALKDISFGSVRCFTLGLPTTLTLDVHTNI